MNVSSFPRPIIRPARPEDDEVIGELLVDAYVTGYGRKMPHIVVTEERKAALRDVRSKRGFAIVFAAELQGEVVGTVSIFPPGVSESEAWVAGAADLRHLAVAPGFHGRGYSEELLNAAEQAAWQLGVPAICLHVRRGNEGVAALYRRRGYVRASEGDLELPTALLDGYVLHRRGNQG